MLSECAWDIKGWFLTREHHKQTHLIIKVLNITEGDTVHTIPTITFCFYTTTNLDHTGKPCAFVQEMVVMHHASGPTSGPFAVTYHFVPFFVKSFPFPLTWNVCDILDYLENMIDRGRIQPITAWRRNKRKKTVCILSLNSEACFVSLTLSQQIFMSFLTPTQHQIFNVFIIKYTQYPSIVRGLVLSNFWLCLDAVCTWLRFRKDHSLQPD